MHRTLCRRAVGAAPLVATPHPTAREVHDSHVISRLLGGADTFGSVSVFTSILDKAKDASVPAAKIGRAAALLRRGDIAHAITDLDAAVSETASQKTALHTMALAMRTAARNQQLDNAENAAANVSGAVEESELSTLRQIVKQDIAELRKTNPNCWTVELAEAEYNLYNGDVETALPALDRVLAKINQEIAQRRVLHVSSTEEESTEAAVALAATRSAFCEATDVSSVKSPAVTDAIKHHSKGADAVAEATAALGKKYALAGLTNEEIGVLAAVNSASKANHHYYKMYPLNEKYSVWNSKSTQDLKSKIKSFYHPSTAVGTSNLDSVSKPESPYEGKTAAEVQKALADAPKGGDIIDHLESTLGGVSTSAHSSGDNAFYDALQKLDANAVAHPTPYHAGDAFSRYQDNFICDLLAQATARVVLAQALCLERKNKLADAAAKLDLIVKEDKFLYMWKVLLARGRINKAQGKLDEGEEDFKKLHLLKKSPGVDIPQLDANRWKSQF